MTARFLVGDVLEQLKTLEDDSVDLVLTSPPFLALRSYLPSDHPDKHLEGGSQATPGEFIDWLVDVVEALDRVLAPHGSMCIELGDTYAGSTADGGDNRTNARYPQGRSHVTTKRNLSRGWPLSKSLTLIPETFRMTLVYGVNPHTGRQTEPWRLRNVIRWIRPNPPVGALGDKFRPATSELMVFCKSPRRYFDLDATRSLVADTPRATDSASFGVAALGPEFGVTFNTDDGAADARGWSNFGSSEISIDGAVTRLTEGFEVTQLVGLNVRIEQAERSFVVDLKSLGGLPAPAASVAVAVERALPGFLPVDAPIVDTTAAPCGAVLASPIGRTPDAIALKTAEVVKAHCRLVSPDRLVARLTLDIDGTLSTALLVAPVELASHKPQPNSNNLSAGAPPLDWWNIPTHGYRGAHYATWPPALCVKPIKAMSPSRVCVTCGEPSRRIVDVEGLRGHDFLRTDNSDNERGLGLHGERTSMPEITRTTTGWTSCGHDTWRPGHVLDCFAGTGVVGAVATGLGRDATLIDLDSRNVELARDRVGPLLFQVVDSTHA